LSRARGRVWLATRREGLDDDDHAAAAAAVGRHPMPLQAQLFVIYSRKQMGIDFWEQMGYISFLCDPAPQEHEAERLGPD